MKRTFFAIVLLSALSLITAGCGCGRSSEPGDGVKSSVTNSQSDAREIAIRVGGDWKKLTKAEKDKLKEQFGSTATAKEMLKNMAHPPNEKYLKKSN